MENSSPNASPERLQQTTAKQQGIRRVSFASKAHIRLFEKSYLDEQDQENESLLWKVVENPTETLVDQYLNNDRYLFSLYCSLILILLVLDLIWILLMTEKTTINSNHLNHF